MCKEIQCWLWWYNASYNIRLWWGWYDLHLGPEGDNQQIDWGTKLPRWRTCSAAYWQCKTTVFPQLSAALNDNIRWLFPQLSATYWQCKMTVFPQLSAALIDKVLVPFWPIYTHTYIYIYTHTHALTHTEHIYPVYYICIRIYSICKWTE